MKQGHYNGRTNSPEPYNNLANGGRRTVKRLILTFKKVALKSWLLFKCLRANTFAFLIPQMQSLPKELWGRHALFFGESRSRSQKLSHGVPTEGSPQKISHDSPLFRTKGQLHILATTKYG